MSLQTKITIAIVVYNKFCAECATFKCIDTLNKNNYNVIVYDNSTKDFKNKEYCEERNVVYLGGEGNNGLSKAYNSIVNYLLNDASSEIICLFDDDTKISEEYFDALIKELYDENFSIFVPVVESNGKIISPFKSRKGHRAKKYKKIEDVFCTNKELGAINSGMAIRLSIFNDYRYDENIFLDGIDHKFILDSRKRGCKIKVLNYVCKHSLSSMEKQSKDSAIIRFRIFVKDYRYILKKSKFAYFRLVGKRALRLTLQYKTLSFFKILFAKDSKENGESL